MFNYSHHQDIRSHDIDYVGHVCPGLTWGRILSTCVISMWSNDTKCKYMFMFPLKHLARKELIKTILHGAWQWQLEERDKFQNLPMNLHISPPRESSRILYVGDQTLNLWITSINVFRAIKWQSPSVTSILSAAIQPPVWSLQAHGIHINEPSLIARFMGQHGAQLGPRGPRWAPCWPHELCYLGTLLHASHLWQKGDISMLQKNFTGPGQWD